MARTPVQPGALNILVSDLVGNEIVAIGTGGPRESQTTVQDIADLAGGGLPPGGYLDQPLTNAGMSGVGQWGNVVYARSGAPGTVATGAALSLNGEQGFTTGDVGYGASLLLPGGRGDTGDGSYGGNGRLAGGSVGSQYGGYIQASGANSYNPGGLYLAGGSGGLYGGTITLAPGMGGTASGDLELLNLPTAVAGLPTGATWIEPGTGALIVAPGTGTGGGGGAAIEPESGPSIKISAMTAAAFAMGPNDFLAGVQVNGDDDLLNAKFSQAQILRGRDATVSTAAGALNIFPGYGYGSFPGASGTLYGGYGAATGGISHGGDANVFGGNAYMDATPGNAFISGGNNTSLTGGDVNLLVGIGANSSTNGKIKIPSLVTSDPTTDDAIWASSGVLMQSGVTNYTGATTITGISTKTLTFQNGILVSIA